VERTAWLTSSSWAVGHDARCGRTRRRALGEKAEVPGNVANFDRKLSRPGGRALVG